MPVTLSAIYRYPIKSSRGESVASAYVEPRGLRGDRRWLIVDADDNFLTGRQHGRITQITAHVDGDALTLIATDMPTLAVQPNRAGERRRVTVWKSTIDALPASPIADAWISEYLGQPARLVFMDAAAHRSIASIHAQPGDEVSFADGFPLLLISQASLDDLNTRLKQPVSMRNFRTNLVIDGADAYAEDTWSRIRIDGIEFDVAKDCVRCVFTTVNPDTGARASSGEPLRTLLGYRRRPDGAIFGQNLVARGTGLLRVGATVDILATRQSAGDHSAK